MSSMAGALHSGRHSFLVTKVGYEGGVRRRFCPSFNRGADMRATRLKGVKLFKSGAVSGPRKSESGELLATNHTHKKMVVTQGQGLEHLPTTVTFRIN